MAPQAYGGLNFNSGGSKEVPSLPSIAEVSPQAEAQAGGGSAQLLAYRCGEP